MNTQQAPPGFGVLVEGALGEINLTSYNSRSR
jgi:hypothetical protein